jgi:hypothetical protein
MGFSTFLTLTLSFGLCYLHFLNPNLCVFIIIYRLSTDSIELGLVSDDELNINVKISLLKVKIFLLNVNVRISLLSLQDFSAQCQDFYTQHQCQNFSAQSQDFSVQTSCQYFSAQPSRYLCPVLSLHSMSRFLCSDLSKAHVQIIRSTLLIVAGLQFMIMHSVYNYQFYLYLQLYIQAIFDTSIWSTIMHSSYFNQLSHVHTVHYYK